MAIEASFTVVAGEFPLAEVFSECSTGQIELDRVVPTNDGLIPYFWLQDIGGSDFSIDEIEHPGIDDLRIIDTVDGEMFVRIDWNLEYKSVLTGILETDVELISAIGQQDKWTFEIRGNDQQDLSAFQTYCRSHDIPIDLVQLHALSPLHSGSEYDLTEPQREALTLAYTRGYYNSPREVTQDDVASEIGITRQAVASRLQRGTRRLIASTLIRPTD